MEPIRAAEAIWRLTEASADVLPGDVQRQYKDVVRYLKGEVLEGPMPEFDPPATDVWDWPIVGGVRRISVVAGERQDSDAHAARGGGPALDFPGPEGARLQPFVKDITAPAWLYDPAQAGHYCEFEWRGSRGLWKTRYCHQQDRDSWTVGQTGNTQGPHLHFILWLNGERVRPEDQPEIQALLA